jgi:hypothetical protein
MIDKKQASLSTVAAQQFFCPPFFWQLFTLDSAAFDRATSHFPSARASRGSAMIHSDSGHDQGTPTIPGQRSMLARFNTSFKTGCGEVEVLA